MYGNHKLDRMNLTFHKIKNFNKFRSKIIPKIRRVNQPMKPRVGMNVLPLTRFLKPYEIDKKVSVPGLGIL